jgi:hypothetical protein
MGRKCTGRTVPIYPRVQAANAEWLNRAAQFTGCKSTNEFIDKLFTTIRRDNKLKELKEEIAKRVEHRAES